ncbi:MAG: HlyD family efflux transporter periplasmic adaptor subunit [Oscillospiraceae bacterium]|nr:HlyD family efflux transporter periplasmic adaptor subunit [Oscillospiraceae bacterium]
MTVKPESPLENAPEQTGAPPASQEPTSTEYNLPFQSTSFADAMQAYLTMPDSPPVSSPPPFFTAPSSEPLPQKMNATKRKKRNKTVKLIVILSIVALIIAGIVVGMYWLFSRQKPVQYVTEVISRGMLETAVQGWGYVRPVESADIAVLNKGRVEESFFDMGDTVDEGDLLFTLDSEEVDKEIEDLHKKIDDIQIKIDKVNEELDVLLGDEAERLSNLAVSAPFKGQLIEAAQLKLGDYVSIGNKVGQFVDDHNLKLSLYFSYTYENDIEIGQLADISIPAAMSVVTGHVSQITKIRRISPEGSALFEVVVALENPGSLAAGMEATATIKSNNQEIYPSETGQLDYSRSEEVLIKAPGKLTYVNVINYMDYNAGETLCRIEYKEDNSQVESLRQQIKTYEQEIEIIEKDIELASEGYDNLNVTAPMSGTIMYNNLIQGEIVEPGLAVISIAQMEKMMVEAQVDERQVSQVRPGMPVEINVWMMDGQMTLPGVVKSVNMTPTENGMGMGGSVNYYPAIFEMDNYSGMLMSGQGVDYRLTVEQKFDILIAPVISVKNTEEGTCVFVKSDVMPDNSIDLGEGIVPSGFFAVPVECGIGNENGIEILSGVEEGAEVFTQIIPLDEMDQGGMRGGGIVYYG